MSWLLPSLSRQLLCTLHTLKSTSHYYLLFAHETLAPCIPVYPWCCLFTLDRIYGGKTDLSEVFMLELACYGAPPRPLHNLAAGDRARPTRCRQLRQGFRGRYSSTSP
ncbi:hypothetical protein FOFC_20654 [Fusarium oxysporum]|nr:hypothetical protein FOFC_20654 [Fusarium oxysporum]